MNFYLKFFTNDKNTNEIYEAIKDNKDIGLEIANYDAHQSKKILNIDETIKNNPTHKMYHSQNKYFMLFNYYSEKNGPIYTRMKKSWKEYWDKEFIYANSIDTKKMVIHFLPQVLPSQKDKRAGLLKQNHNFIEYLMKLSKKYNVKIYFENSFERTIEEFDFMIKYVKSNFNTDIGICYDIGHTNVWGLEKDSLKDWIDYITTHDLDIHYHIHTNDGYNDEHQSLSLHTNEPEYENHCKALKYLLNTGTVKNLTLEVDNHSFINDYEYIKSIVH